VTQLLVLMTLIGFVAYRTGKAKSYAAVGGRSGLHRLHSLPGYYGALTAIWCVGPALLVAALWALVQPQVLDSLILAGLPEELRGLTGSQADVLASDIRHLAAGYEVITDVTPALREAAARYASLKAVADAALLIVVLGVGTGGGWLLLRHITPQLRARNRVEQVMRWTLIGCSTVAVFTTIGIVMSVLVESLRFLQSVSPIEFLFGLQWSPQTAIRADQVGASGSFGAVPLFAGTALISAIALSVAVPIGLMSAVFLSEYASARLRAVAKPMLEILAGIPTVVYGFFAALTIAPFVRDVGGWVGLSVASESALAAGLVMGIMIIPFVSSLSDDVISAVPSSMRDGSLGLGATHAETILRVVLPAALPGVVGSILLAASRAIGETMIVVMAAGLAANLTGNPLEAVTTVTVQIVTLLIGDQEFDSPKTLAAFALGLVLFVVTLLLNIVALQVVRRYREQYE
jgi:phosphate transport system permease protein